MPELEPLIELSLLSLQETANNRPRNYLNDVLSLADVNGDSVFLRHGDYEFLVEKYKSYKEQAFDSSAGSGPGTELSKLLKRFGIEPTPTCSCRAKAAEMDAWGCDECSKPERIEEVVAVMREEAKARGLPFLDVAARLLVRRAIHNARKAEAASAREAERPPLHTEQ